MGRGGEAANSSEMSRGWNLTGGRSLRWAEGDQEQVGFADKRKWEVRTKGISEWKGGFAGESPLRWAWPAFRGDAKELPAKHHFWENKDGTCPQCRPLGSRLATLGL